MANEVYANNMEVSCKAAAGKSICAFPDVCMTPPQTPATPPGVPIPYPNTGMASDTTSGSTSVKVSNQEVMLKNKSYFSKSTGDEAGSAPMKGVVTHKNMGKVYFNAWSMDVKVEGENVVRMMDLTTHNHGSAPGNSPTWPYIDAVAVALDTSHPCHEVVKGLADNNCQKHVKANTYSTGAVNRAGASADLCGDPKCKKAMECVLTPYSPSNCCDGQTPHHVVPKSQFKERGAGGKPLLTNSAGDNLYDPDKAPCICEDGHSHSTGTHGDIHEETNLLTVNHPTVAPHVTGKTIDKDARWTVGEAEAVGAEASEKGGAKCKEGCTQSQVRAGHQQMGIKESDKIRPSTAGHVPDPMDTTAL
ncbi:MAG: HNH/endonuclease VII fold toxin-2 domain-containing protein [Aquabacterium sp.]